MSNLTIQYKQTPIGPGINLLRCAFLNSGSLDIEKASIHEPVQILFPEEFEILEYKLLSDSAATITKQDNTLLISWDLLKRGELIPFNVLLRVPQESIDKAKGKLKAEEFIEKSIILKSRITNLDRIKRIEAPPPRRQKLGSRMILTILYTVMFLILLGVTTYRYISKENTVAFSYANGFSNALVVAISAKSKDTLLLREQVGRKKFAIPLSQFSLSQIEGIDIIQKRGSSFYSILALTSLQFLMSAFFWLWIYRENAVRRKIKNIYEYF